MQNISVVDVLLILIMLSNIIIGIRLGFVKALLTFVRFIAAYVLAKLYSVKLTSYIIENTNWENALSEKIGKSLSSFLAKNPNAQSWREQVNLTNMPDLLEKYAQELLDTASKSLTDFAEYLSDNLARLSLELVSFVAIFVSVLILARLLIAILDALSKLPLINTANRLGGALIGAVKGLLYCFLFATLLYLANMLGMDSLSPAINASKWISYFYFGYLFT